MKSAFVALLTAFMFPLIFREIIEGHILLFFAFCSAVFLGSILLCNADVGLCRSVKGFFKSYSHAPKDSETQISCKECSHLPLFGFIALLVCGISIFAVLLPWLQTTELATMPIISIEKNVEPTGIISGISLSGGIFGMLVAVVGGLLVLNQHKWSFMAGVINAGIGVMYLNDFPVSQSLCISSSFAAGNGFISPSVLGSPQSGLYLFIGMSLLFTVLAIGYTMDNDQPRLIHLGDVK
ncbi:MAG TPA: hypothetical protein PKN57_03235 [Saprospiraceae bacterium]|nr:hypothetical protein [Saprospiraceae bacterium]HMV24446.1 hypothetical protein [Saprospiraceae bacterium]HNE47563.1 hypothetical protein [Saprospiraceae bacterium]HNG05989.1 hypothetical protein [Saprospiraceae bacterium]HNJ62133.1 hypothetical protein [Saprospiraceae bacterium]